MNRQREAARLLVLFVPAVALFVTARAIGVPPVPAAMIGGLTAAIAGMAIKVDRNRERNRLRDQTEDKRSNV